MSRMKREGEWFALNKATLNIPDHYPLLKNLESLFGLPALALNDATAAAFGEYAYGAADHQDCVFLTISTGLGGGIVANGALLIGHNGLAGHFGIMKFEGETPIESRIAGRWIANQTRELGHEMDARQVFEAANKGQDWAERIIQNSAERLALLIADIALAIDPPVFVIGGSIGLAEGYLARVQNSLSKSSLPLGELRPAKLGKLAPTVGAEAYSRQIFNSNIKVR